MIQNWLYGAAAALFAIAGARILFLVCLRRPIQARTCQGELPDRRGRHNRDTVRMARSDGLLAPTDPTVGIVTARVAYRINGVEHRADVRLLTHKGDRAALMPVVWYDPDNPARVTGLGLGGPLLVLLVAGGLGMAGYNCGL